MDQEQNNKKGIIIFIGLALVFLVLGLVAYKASGDKGIEERFSNALGIYGESESAGKEIFGFKLEGDPTSYVVILALILAATALSYIYIDINIERPL
ncbi:MAG: hypothetical protein OIN87_02660 [Candidatus Methanoperedens sp.]|nr:hypothetical protein [Candidatus Methanoperedens sp.]